MSESKQQPDRPELDLIKKHCDALMGHFDTVQIFATKHHPITEGGTLNIRWGAGNFFAGCGSWGRKKTMGNKEKGEKVLTVQELIETIFNLDSNVDEIVEARENIESMLSRERRLGRAEGMREAARFLDIQNQTILLLAGELTSQEMRTVRAVLGNRHDVILAAAIEHGEDETKGEK